MHQFLVECKVWSTIKAFWNSGILTTTIIVYSDGNNVALVIFCCVDFFGADCVLNFSANLMSLLRLGWKVTKPLQVKFCQLATYQQ